MAAGVADRRLALAEEIPGIAGQAVRLTFIEQ
jgi:hypothetical protein